MLSATDDMSERNGITVGGTILLDKINEIDAYPSSGELTQIKSIKLAPGGCIPNVGCDLKKMRATLKVSAVGKIGCDAEGKYLLDVLKGCGLLTDGIIESDTQKTSFTDVMSVSGGQRTFFTYPGASAEFGFDDIDFDSLDCKIFHLAYFLLLDRVDNGDGLRILKEAKRRGILTSIDLVSENSDRYKAVLPCLEYTDYLIINEMEASKLTGISPCAENLEDIAKMLLGLGVSRKVIIHMPDLACSYSREYGFTAVPSYEISKEEIAGTTGAGDAFCAAALLGIYDEKNDREILEFASAAAAISLRTPDATGGIVSEKEIKTIFQKRKRKQLCL